MGWTKIRQAFLESGNPISEWDARQLVKALKSQGQGEDAEPLKD